jgi:hypothetical protein
VRSRTALAAVLTGAAVALSGCGTAPGTDAVTTAAGQWLSAARAKDAATLCRLLTPAARGGEQSGGQSCEQTVGDLDLPGAGPVGAVQVWSDRAQVKTPGDTLFLTEIRGRWLVSGAGCTYRGDVPYDCEVGG